MYPIPNTVQVIEHAGNQIFIQYTCDWIFPAKLETLPLYPTSKVNVPEQKHCEQWPAAAMACSAVSPCADGLGCS